MDLIRSCYRTRMRLGEGLDPVPVVWSFAQPGADMIGIPTPFCSANWEIGEDERWSSYLGEQQSARPFVNGSILQGFTGRRLCFPSSWFGEGVPAGEPTGRAVDTAGNPICCQDARPQKGGVIVGGSGAVKPFNCHALADDLTLTITASGSCACIDAVSITLSRPNNTICHWEGETGFLCSFGQKIFFKLDYDGTDWKCSVECFFGFIAPDPTPIIIVPSPFRLAFSVTENVGCCSTFSTEAWQFEITE